MRRTLVLVFISLILLGCDDHQFTQIFRNPYIIEVADMATIKKDQWYQFKTEVKALNRNQDLVIEFDGSEPDKIKVFSRGSDENFEGGESVFESTDFPNKEIVFDVVAIDSDGIEYLFEASGLSTGVILHSKTQEELIGKTFNEIKIKSNLTHNNVIIKWISYTGK